MSATFETGLGIFFLLGMLMNLGFASYYFRAEKNATAGLFWTIVAGLYLVHAVGFLGHLGLVMPQGTRAAVDAMMGPVTYTTLSVVGFCAFIYFRRTLTNPHVAWGLLNLSLLFSGWAVTDPEFRK